MGAEEAERWGFFNRLAEPDVEAAAAELAASLASGPTFAHSMTKTMLDQEWDMSLPAAIEAEAQAQAICMQTRDFERAYRAFLAKERPGLRGRLTVLEWPFFEDRHREFAAWAADASPERGGDRPRRALPRVRRARSPTAGCRPRVAEPLDVRTLCLARETLAYHDALADFAFAMQGLGAGPITLFGDDALRARYLPGGRGGREDRGVRALRAGRRLRRGGDDDHARTATVSPASRPGSPTAGSPTSTRCSRARPRASAPTSSTPRTSRSRSAST